MKHFESLWQAASHLLSSQMPDLPPLVLTPLVVARLEAYFALLSEWTKRVDLVAEGTPEALFRVHGIDAIAGYRILFRAGPPQGPLLDAGSGAGLPGLVWAVLADPAPVHLCEPRAKRTVFLKECRRRLDLTGVVVHESRLEEVSEAPQFSLISFRALRPEGPLLQAALKRVRPGGRIAWLAGAEPVPDGATATAYSLSADTKGRKIIEIGKV